VSECIHCGFCLSSCPTYEATRRELVLMLRQLVVAQGEEDLLIDGQLYRKHLDGSGSLDTAGTTDDLEQVRLFFTNQLADADKFVDEIRIGESFADVTPVPEPSTMGLGLMGMALLMARRGR